jgi:hypothetical protein
MIDEMTSAEFQIRFPEPSSSAARLHYLLGHQVYRLLWLAGNVLPEDCQQLRGLIGTVLTEVNRGDDTALLRRIGIQLLGLACPVIDERDSIRDQVERLLTESDNSNQRVEEKIPY